jgi:hypothetical protein
MQASGFDPTAGSFVPGGFTPPPAAPAAEPAPDPAPAPAPAAAPEAKEETWESEPNVEAKEDVAASKEAEEAAEAVDDLKLDDEMKKELAAMKAEGLIDEEEEAEIVSGKVSQLCMACACSGVWCVRSSCSQRQRLLVRDARSLAASFIGFRVEAGHPGMA